MSVHPEQGMSEEDLPDFRKISFSPCQPIPLEEIFPDASRDALDLLKCFLVYPSKKRISAKDVSVQVLFVGWLVAPHHLIGLAVKASASRAADMGLDFRLQ